MPTAQPRETIERHVLGPRLGAALRAARQGAGLGLREAARRLHIGYRYLILLEQGKRAFWGSGGAAGRIAPA